MTVVNYSAGMRKRAKTEGLSLYCVEVTGKGGKGLIRISGPGDEKLAKRIRRFVLRVSAQLAADAARRQDDAARDEYAAAVESKLKKA